MTKLDWTKVGVRNPDPGAVIEVHDNGGVWCGTDARPFVPRSHKLRIIAKKAKKRRAKRSSKKSEIGLAPQRSTLRVPLEKARLIASVMRDLGRPIPDKIKPVNRAIDRLIRQGVLHSNGDFNPDHPLLRRWLARVEKLSVQGHHGTE